MTDALPPQPKGPNSPFDRERFVFKTLALVISTELLIYSLAAGVCAVRALGTHESTQNRSDSCSGTLERVQMGLDSTLNMLLALLGGAALTKIVRSPER